LNPSPLSSAAFFESTGNGYRIDPVSGKPGDDRPGLQQLWRLVAKSPRLAACFFHSYVEAFQEVYLGWPPGADRQQDANCPFGH
jgi:hypothetical protein